MPYCDNCEKFKEKIVNSKFGLWFGYCSQFEIGRSIDSDICSKYKEKNGIEISIIHRADIKKERLDECFE